MIDDIKVFSKTNDYLSYNYTVTVSYDKRDLDTNQILIAVTTTDKKTGRYRLGDFTTVKFDEKITPELILKYCESFIDKIIDVDENLDNSFIENGFEGK